MDPSLEQFDLFCGQGFAGIGRRHEILGILRGDAGDDLTLSGITGHDRVVSSQIGPGPLWGVETQFGLAVILIGAVAVEAVVGQNRADVPIELNGLISGRQPRPEETGARQQDRPN